jgi:hypothetical protein
MGCVISKIPLYFSSFHAPRNLWPAKPVRQQMETFLCGTGSSRCRKYFVAWSIEIVIPRHRQRRPKVYPQGVLYFVVWNRISSNAKAPHLRGAFFTCPALAQGLGRENMESGGNWRPVCMVNAFWCPKFQSRVSSSRTDLDNRQDVGTGYRMAI